MAKETVTFDNIPEWAIGALEYGGDECGALTEEDIALVNTFIIENFPNGYCISVNWDECREFDAHPAFGKACKTYEVNFLLEA